MCIISIIRTLCLFFFVSVGSSLAAGETLRIHLISGSAEYESEHSLRQLQRVLEDEYRDVSVTASWGRDAGDHLPAIAAMADADLAIIFARRMVLPDEQLAFIRGHAESEKAVIGIRTASHAFQGYPIDAEVFGGSYSGHGRGEPVEVTIADGAESHPILSGVGGWIRSGKIYHNRELGQNTTPLLYGKGQVSDLHEPLAWTNQYGESGRAFYTSMGMPLDFENQNFRNLIFNAIEWTTGRELTRKPVALDLSEADGEYTIPAADLYLLELPVTITAFSAERSTGGKHDYYSEGDYWWPDPNTETGLPYIQRDGESNPNNFFEHRLVMRRLSLHVPTLTAAYLFTGDGRYAEHAVAHLEAWFVNEETRMNPTLLYSQAIPGRVTGRGIGIIDTLHLAEVARAAKVLADEGILVGSAWEGVRNWFRDFHSWINTHEYGIAERDHPNNHSTAWLLQAAAFAHLIGDDEKLEEYRERYKTIIIPNQMAGDGSFPRELGRTKPYGYSLFNWDLLGALTQLLSTSEENLWEFSTEEGQGMKQAMEFIYPFIVDKSAWPLSPDIEYDDEWPVRHPTLLFAGLAYDNEDYVTTWKRLSPKSNVHEVIRNFPVRQPRLWLNEAP